MLKTLQRYFQKMISSNEDFKSNENLSHVKLLETIMTADSSDLTQIQSAGGLLLNDRNGRAINWNPFNTKSRYNNVYISGMSGSGRTVFIQNLLLSGLKSGYKAFVIDIGRDYEKMCNSIDGQHIDFSESLNICLNPFSIISEVDEEERGISFIYLKTIITCMASPNKEISKYENSLLETAIRFAWNKKKTLATITDVSDFLKSKEDIKAKSLGDGLFPYTKEGIYGKYLEGKNNVSFTSSMVLVELEKIEDTKDLQKVILQLFIMSIINQASLDEQKTPFYISIEGPTWDLLRGKQTVAFVETLTSRLGKYNGSLIAGTYGIVELLLYPGHQKAFENSGWFCLLPQNPSTIRRLAKQIEMTPENKKKFEAIAKGLESITIARGEYSEIAIGDREGSGSICRLYLDPTSHNTSKALLNSKNGLIESYQ